MPTTHTAPVLLQPASPSSSPSATWSGDGRIRAVVETVLPAVDGGRFAVKCVAGEPFTVTAHCFTDGHDALRVMLAWRKESDAQFTEVPMAPLGNDEWQARWVPPSPGRYRPASAASRCRPQRQHWSPTVPRGSA